MPRSCVIQMMAMPSSSRKPLDQLDDLRLDGHVERGRRLVGDEQLRRARQRHGDHHALAHSAGELVRVIVEPVGGLRDADHAQQFDGALAGLLLVHAHVQFQRLGELAADRQHGVEARHRVLKDHGDLRAAHVADLFRRHLEQVLALEERLPAGNLAGRFGDQTQEREHADAFAAAALAHNAQGLAFVHFIADAVDRVDESLAGMELGFEVLDLKQSGHSFLHSKIGSAGSG